MIDNKSKNKMPCIPWNIFTFFWGADIARNKNCQYKRLNNLVKLILIPDYFICNPSLTGSTQYLIFINCKASLSFITYFQDEGIDETYGIPVQFDNYEEVCYSSNKKSLSGKDNDIMFMLIHETGHR